MSKKTPRKVLILGGGFAGLKCAQTLANDSRFEVTLLDKQNHHLFQPLLYQVATAALSAPDITRSLRGILVQAKNVSVVLDEVVSVNAENKEVSTKTGNVYSYDKLIVAVGARTSFFGRDEWARHTDGLKTLQDARHIRAKVLHNLEIAERIHDAQEQQRLMTVVIVGGGPTGVELAGAFADLVQRALHQDYRHIDPAKMKVILVQAMDRVLEHFSPDHSTYAHEQLQNFGVEVRLNQMVTNVEEGKVHLNNGDVLEASTIIWAAGVQAQDLCRTLPCPQDRGGRLQVLPDLSFPDHRDIFAAGDIVNLLNVDGKPIPGVAPAASQMGVHIAKTLKEELRLEKTRYADRVTEFRPRFKYLDKGMMAIIGKNQAVSQSGFFKLKGFPAWVAWLLIHIAFLVGFRNKLFVLLSWAFAYVFNKPGARVFSVDESRPLPSQLVDKSE